MNISCWFCFSGKPNSVVLGCVLGTQSCLSDATWTVAHQAPLSTEFSRPEHRNGLPFPSPGELPNPGIEPRSLALQVDSLAAEPPGETIQL